MATSSSKYKEIVKRMYYSVRNSRVVYLNIVNLQQKKALGTFDFKISDTQKKVLNDLNLNGVSVINFSDLLDESLLNNMSEWIVNNEKNLTTKHKKKFLLSYFGTENKELLLDVTNPFVRFYLSSEILEITSLYLGYIPQLFEVYVEKTIPVGLENPTYSQNWHRDPEEKRTLKVFVYLSDVTDDAGPFTYVMGSAPTGMGKYKKLFPQKLPHGSYPSEMDVSSKIGLDDLLTATGIKGSIIFCDTSGLHRGGYAKSQHRIMATGFYPSKHYSEGSRFSVNGLEKSARSLIVPLARKVLGISEKI
jgi:hypothetical protein